MSNTDDDKTPLQIIAVGGLGGLCVGTIAGGLGGVVFLPNKAVRPPALAEGISGFRLRRSRVASLLLDFVNSRSANQPFDLGLLLLTLLIGFAVGAVYGAISGALAGLLLGVIFPLVRNCWIGVVGGAIISGVAAAYERTGPAALHLASPFELDALFIATIIGGAIAGYIVCGILLRFVDNNQKPSAN